MCRYRVLDLHSRARSRAQLPSLPGSKSLSNRILLLAALAGAQPRR